MDETIKILCGYIALCVEAVAAVMIAYGTIEALVRLAPILIGRRSIGQRRNVRIQFGVCLLLALEFELAADIVRTAIAPSWTDIGQLASIAVIRTALNYFLEADIDALQEQDKSGVVQAKCHNPTE